MWDIQEKKLCNVEILLFKQLNSIKIYKKKEREKLIEEIESNHFFCFTYSFFLIRLLNYIIQQQ